MGGEERMMEFTREEIETAALVLVVDSEGNFKWSSTKPDVDVANMLHAVALEVGTGLVSERKLI